MHSQFIDDACCRAAVLPCCRAAVLPCCRAAVLPMASGTGHAQDAENAVALGKKLTTDNGAVCHTFAKDEPSGQRPNLFGIFGRPFASEPDFKYSAGMKAAAPGKVWDAKLLDAWLTDTQRVAPGNAMTYFEGDEIRRQKIIAYLRTLH